MTRQKVIVGVAVALLVALGIVALKKTATRSDSGVASPVIMGAAVPATNMAETGAFVASSPAKPVQRTGFTEKRRRKSPSAADGSEMAEAEALLREEVAVSTEIAAILPSAQEEVGNDPTALRSRFEIGDEYFNNSGGPDWHLATLRIDGAPNPKVAFRLDLPYMFLKPDGKQYELDRGLADVMFRASAVIKKTPRAGFTAYSDFWFDTAESVDFGLGKYSAGPGVAMTLMNPYKDVLLSGSLQHKFSYAGDPSRTDISRTRMEIILDKSLRERQWIVMNPVIFLDWVSGRSAGDLEMEAGTRMGDHWSAWVRPGVGVWGQAVSGGYNSYVQAGVRYLFGEPLREKILNDLRSKSRS